VATAYNLQKIIRDIVVCIDFIIPEVIVTFNFPARRVFRYAGMDVLCLESDF
jgi:hypothetical protein